MASPAILYSRRNDDLPALIAEISRQEASHVLLVAPVSSELFRSALNMRLLKEECDRLGKKLSLSTQDPAGMAFAKSLGIAVQQLTEGEKFFEEWSQKLSANPHSSMPLSPSFSHEPQEHAPASRRAMDISPVRRSQPVSPKQDEARVAGEEIAQFFAPAQKPAAHEVSAGPAFARTEDAQEEAEEYEDDVTATPAMRMRDPEEESSPKPAAAMRMRRPMGAVTAGIVVLAIIAAAAVFIKPAAVVTVQLKEEPLEFEMDVTARTEITAVEAANAIVPLQRLRVEETTTREFPATGNRDITSKAHGRITVYNAFGPTSQPLVATTRFLSESGKIFRTLKAVVIPGGHMEEGKLVPGKLVVDVTADQAGEAYNIPASHFFIPGFAGSPREKAFYGISEEPMTGGFTGKTNVVEKKDIEDARAALLPLEKTRLEQVLRAKLPGELTLIDKALQVTTESAEVSPREGEPGKTLALTVRTSAEAFLFREQDVLSVLEPGITQHLGAAYTIVPDTRKVSYTLKESDPKLGRIVFTVLVSLRTRPALNSSELAQNLAGKQLGDVKTFFADQAQSHIEKADLSLRPFWARRLPGEADRITVKISASGPEK